MKPVYARDPEALEPFLEAAREEGGFALDCEAAGFHRYSDQLCLVQLTAAGSTALIDPFAFDPAPALRTVVEDPSIRVWMHGSDYDFRLLDRDLDIRIRGVFDTQIAAQLLGEDAIGLSSLLEKFLGVSLSKKYQRADWAQRPLPEEMLQYAAADTQHLPELVRILDEKLVNAGRRDWAAEEFALLEETRWEDPEPDDPVERVKGAHELDPVPLARLRAGLAWRDRIAQERDKATFRIASDNVLLEAAENPPRSAQEFGQRKGVSGGLARAEGDALVEALREVELLPPEQIPPYPEPDRSGPGRPPPEVEELARSLKEVRNREAEKLGLDRGTLLPNASLMEIAWAEPDDLGALRAVPGVKNWQVEAIGEAILERLTQRTGAR